ncbi:MAG: helix-turn-helix domain-containing protein [Acetivibrionales bacterium]|jgi:transcriptional regulator with XRE-family HTH domain
MERLRKLRNEKCMTQCQLAEKARVSQAYINELENGKKHNPSVSILGKLAKALGVATSDLIDDDSPSWKEGCKTSRLVLIKK